MVFFVSILYGEYALDVRSACVDRCLFSMLSIFCTVEPKGEIGLKQSTLRLPGPVVATAWVAEALDNRALRLIDLRDRESYTEGHLPGAVQLELPAITGKRDGVEGMLISGPDFAARLGAAGVDASKTVVLYDDNWGMAAARLLWALARFGFANAAVMDGGWDRWQEEERVQSTSPVNPPPAQFELNAADEQLAERAWLLHEAGRDDLVIIDTRTPNEYQQGHVPQAINWDWMNAVPEGSWDLMRPAAELRSELATLGVTPDKEIVTYCRSGVRAAHTYLVLRALGFPRVRNYDGSWLEWSHHLNNVPATARGGSNE